jgi:hypothetical protein
MKAVHDVPGTEELRAAAAAVGDPPPTLAEEHALLLEQVAIRAQDVLTAAAGNRWPAQELQRLLGYVRAEVLRQAEDEEMLLFTPAARPRAWPGCPATMRASAMSPRRWSALLPARAPGHPPGSPPSPAISSASLSIISPPRRSC